MCKLIPSRGHFLVFHCLLPWITLALFCLGAGLLLSSAEIKAIGCHHLNTWEVKNLSLQAHHLITHSLCPFWGRPLRFIYECSSVHYWNFITFFPPLQLMHNVSKVSLMYFEASPFRLTTEFLSLHSSISVHQTSGHKGSHILLWSGSLQYELPWWFDFFPIDSELRLQLGMYSMHDQTHGIDSSTSNWERTT